MSRHTDAESQANGAVLAAARRAIVLGSGTRQNILTEAQRLMPLVQRYLQVVQVDFTGAVDFSRVEADVAVVFGGDGSILHAAHQMGSRQLPVLAVNLGRLGFLADLDPQELEPALRDLCAGKLTIIEHLMYQCRLLRGGNVVEQALGLNEVAVHAGPPFTILDIDLYVDAELVTTYSCDGLIVATPVGSTAHSLSAGGPILRKNMQAFVISPISPHALTNRPVVDAADHVYEMVVPRPHPQSSVVADGRVLRTLQPDDRIRVEPADVCFQLVTCPGHSYYRTLREKLGWGGRLQIGFGP